MSRAENCLKLQASGCKLVACCLWLLAFSVNASPVVDSLRMETINGKQYIIFPSGLGSQALGFVAQIWPELNDYPAGAALVAFTVN